LCSLCLCEGTPWTRSKRSVFVLCSCLGKWSRVAPTSVLVEAVQLLHERGRERVPGPIGAARDVVRRLRWKWASPFALAREELQPLDARAVDAGCWGHEVREGLRATDWNAAAGRRRNCAGMEAGVDRSATSALLRSSQIGACEKGMLRGILADAIWTQDRLHRAGLVAS
jgi:hypothetical protein